MGGLVFFSSASGNTARFVERLGLPAQRIGLRMSDPLPVPTQPYLLICPTYADNEGGGAVPKQVIRFLNDAGARALLRGVIAGGNRNFGRFYGHAGDVIAKKCAVPLFYRFELAGTETDVARVRDGIAAFWRDQCSTVP